MSPEIARKLIPHFQKHPAVPAEEIDGNLTPQEIRLLQLLSDGLQLPEVRRPDEHLDQYRPQLHPQHLRKAPRQHQIRSCRQSAPPPFDRLTTRATRRRKAGIRPRFFYFQSRSNTRHSPLQLSKKRYGSVCFALFAEYL